MFKSIGLYTNKLKQLKRFYQNVLELEISNVSEETFTVQIGTSQLVFQEGNQPAFYHFAINIPGNQFSQMKYWMEDKLQLNRDGGLDKVYFPSFDADAMYFEDPAGNIIELIGRRNRDMFGSLTSKAFLNLSEVGIVTPHVLEVGDDLQDFGIPLRHGTEVDENSVNFFGRGDTFVVLTPPNRKWYFSKRESQTYPLEITLTNGQHMNLDTEGHIVLSQKETQ